MKNLYPILEFDPAREALIEPRRVISPEEVPRHCVVCFFQDVIAGLRRSGALRLLRNQRSEMGDHPIYAMEVEGRPLAVFHPGVGAPLAGGFLDELIALGFCKFIACGGAGVLDPAIACGHVIVAASAVRDEGTSYHYLYLPPGREVEAGRDAVAAIEATLRERGCDYVLGKTWTTDAIYRETPAKIALRKAEGCLTVEMEAAAFFAVAQFRGVQFGQLLYGGDDCGSETWDGRGWQARATVREKLFSLAAEACLRL